MNHKAIEQELVNHILSVLEKEAEPALNEKNIRRMAFLWLEKKNILLPEDQMEKIAENAVYSILGFGPLEPLLKDNTVTEIMVNGVKNIFIERNGKIEETELHFSDEEKLMSVINRIVGKIGRRIDESSPLVDARLEDGSRVNAIIPPLSLCGPVLTIRKFPDKKFTIHDLLKKKTISESMAEFLALCVEAKKNIIISGGTGSGKTCSLNALAGLIPKSERVITLEDSAEIRIDHPHWVSLETRLPNLEGKGEIPMRTLVKNALRMRPDRIVVGEVRGAETLDMLQAMNTGHEGSLTTVHANSPIECLYRVETMVLMGNTDIPLEAIRPQVIQGIDIIIHHARLSNGERKMMFISEIIKKNLKEYEVKHLFKYDENIDRFVNVGSLPKWLKNTDFERFLLKKIDDAQMTLNF